MHQNKLCNIGTLFRIISSNMLSHWYLHLIAFFLHYSWVASYRNFLLNYLYFSSVYFFTIEQNIFFYIKTQCYFLLTCTCNSLPKDICAAHFHKLYDIHKYHRVFMMCMQQFSKLRIFLFWNAPSKLSDFNTHRANNKINMVKREFALQTTWKYPNDNVNKLCKVSWVLPSRKKMSTLNNSHYKFP